MCPAYTYSDCAHDLEQNMFNKMFKFSDFLCLICLYEGLFCKIGITAVIKTSPYKIKSDCKRLSFRCCKHSKIGTYKSKTVGIF